MYKELTDYYRSKGISALEFNCKHFYACSQQDPKSFTTAKEAFVSVGYVAHNLPRILFVSLDSGSAETDPNKKTLESVRMWEEEMENIFLLHKNKHWYRTHELAYTLLRNFKTGLRLDEARNYFAHINSAKCCQNNPGRGQANQILFDNCREFIPGEIEILDPDVIITQGRWGKFAIEGVFQELRTPDYVSKELQEIKILLINNHAVLWIETFHPRNGNFHAVNKPHYSLYEQVIIEFMKSNTLNYFNSLPQLVNKFNKLETNGKNMQKSKTSIDIKENAMDENLEKSETYYHELEDYPDYPATDKPSKSECKGYTFMSMVQVCNLAETFGKSRGFAHRAFGGDRGAIKVQSDREPWFWEKGGKKVKKFVLVRAVERFFEEEGFDWR